MFNFIFTILGVLVAVGLITVLLIFGASKAIESLLIGFATFIKALGGKNTKSGKED